MRDDTYRIKWLSATDISALASMKNVAKCDTWCELQNPVNHRVFERKLRPKPLGRGHVCLGVTHRCPNAERLVLDCAWGGSWPPRSEEHTPPLLPYRPFLRPKGGAPKPLRPRARLPGCHTSLPQRRTPCSRLRLGWKLASGGLRLRGGWKMSAWWGLP